MTEYQIYHDDFEGFQPVPKVSFWKGVAIALALSIVLWGIIIFSAWAVWG